MLAGRSVALTLWACAVGASLLASGACAPRGERPVDVVRALHAAIDADDLERAATRVDFRYRVAEMLGDLFAEAPAADQDAAVALARQMFFDTTRAQWAPSFAGRPTTLAESRREPPHVWIEATASGDDRPEFVWIYRLTPHRGTWRVTQREYRSGPGRSDTTAFYPQAVRHLRVQLGRAPTLAELNANLPSLVGRLRARTIRIPELPSRTSP